MLQNKLFTQVYELQPVNCTSKTAGYTIMPAIVTVHAAFLMLLQEGNYLLHSSGLMFLTLKAIVYPLTSLVYYQIFVV